VLAALAGLRVLVVLVLVLALLVRTVLPERVVQTFARTRTD
jgi:hypothetical protein